MARKPRPEQPPPHLGRFVVLEGLDGAGTTTQSNLLVARLRERGRPALFTGEPSVGPMGHIIRLMLTKRLVSERTSPAQAELSNDSIALLFAADRLDHLQHEILPQLARGLVVVCDRYYLSSYAYQMSADRSNYEWLQAINSRCRAPDLTLFLRTDPAVCEERRRRDRWHRELFEEPEILERVAGNYEHVIADRRRAGDAILVLDGNRSQEEVHRRVVGAVGEAFPECAP